MGHRERRRGGHTGNSSPFFLNEGKEANYGMVQDACKNETGKNKDGRRANGIDEQIGYREYIAWCVRKDGGNTPITEIPRLLETISTGQVLTIMNGASQLARLQNIDEEENSTQKAVKPPPMYGQQMTLEQDRKMMAQMGIR